MLSHKDEQVLKLKAAIWESGNEERLLSKAIRSYKKDEEKEQPKDTVEVVVKGKYVLVRDVPHITNHGELYENIHLTATLEKVIGESCEELPKEISFKELID